MSKKILFLLSNRKTDTYGVTSGLFNSATFAANFLKKSGFDVKLESVVDSNSVDRVVTAFDPDVVIVEALWIPPAKFKELFKIQRHLKRRWIVRVHSKAPFLANEGMATQWIHEYTLIDEKRIEIAPNTRELVHQLEAAFPYGEFIYLPNIYEADKFKNTNISENPNILNVGSFGAIRPMKNTYQQALAALDFAERKDKLLRFHINSTRVEQRGENVLKNLKALFDGSNHELVEHVWYKHKDFIQAASKMDVGMQVSFSESFNIVTADFVTAGVPIVISDDIEWMPWILKTPPTSHKGMVKNLGRALRWKKVVVFLQKLYLKAFNSRAKSAWFIRLKF